MVDIPQPAERARRRMVQEQIIARGIQDSRVVSAMATIPRHVFVDEAMSPRAYHDCALPIGGGQTISQPYMVARMSELLALNGSERILEVGTGCGYQTAILAMLGRRVYTIERVEALHTRARQNLLRCRLLNRIVLKCDDGLLGWDEYAPFDAIIVTAGGIASDAWMSQLVIGGRLLMPEGKQGKHQLVMRVKLKHTIETKLFDQCTFVPLLSGTQ